ncbi:MAG: uroporphyrinogen decarboxylase family protein [Nibricoccus sp.]
MDRKFYLELAASGLRMPIGTHLVLHRYTNADEIVLDGEKLGGVLIETAQRFKTPLAVPLMDLTLEKEALLLQLGVPASEVSQFHCHEPVETPNAVKLTRRMEAACRAIEHVAKTSDLVPMGMSIGPFSLMTKLLADPITPVFLAGTGATAAEEPDIALVEAALAAGEKVISAYLEAQIAAGAKAIIVCEPAANLVYFSPKQLEQDFAVFDRLVMAPMLRISNLLHARGVDLIFHDCGELTDEMVKRFALLGAAMISLGSSRKLWEDAALIPKNVVLYGNLPTKRFYASQLSVREVESMASELVAKMRSAGHPFILGSECDVLSVAGSEQEIIGKVDAFMSCGCRG